MFRILMSQYYAGLNNPCNLYQGRPTLIFLIRKGGKPGVAGSKGPFGPNPSIEATQEWLNEYKETVKEPNLPRKRTSEDKPDVIIGVYKGS